MSSLDSLSKRARRALISLDCAHIEDAAKLGERDLLRCADVGPKTLWEIKDRLKRIGLDLKTYSKRDEEARSRETNSRDILSNF